MEIWGGGREGGVSWSLAVSRSQSRLGALRMDMNQDVKLGLGAAGKVGRVLAVSRSELRLGVLLKDMNQDLKFGFGLGWGRKDESCSSL